MGTRENSIRWFLGLAFVLFLAPSAIAKIIYVDDDARGANTGTSWANAYQCLQDALKVSISGNEIRVAQGTYKPDQGMGVTLGDRQARFYLKDGVTLQGGYAGLGASDPDERDWNRYPTILSGDLLGNDVPDVTLQEIPLHPSRSDNSHTVVLAMDNVQCVVDGFVIRNGHAEEGLAGGLFCEPASSLTLQDCRFVENYGIDGGAIDNHSSQLRLVGCTFIHNQASAGGAMFNYSDISPIIVDCRFIGNMSSGNGGAIDNHVRCSPTFVNCLFTGNSSRLSGGAMYNVSSSPVLINCTFSQNVAEFGGAGGISASDGVLTLANCILWGNRGQTNAGIISQLSATIEPNLCSCSIQGWTGGSEGGNHGRDPLFVNADGLDNVPGTEDDDLRLLAGSPCIDTGQNSALPPQTDRDLAGNPRIVNQTVDMGAYEGANQGFLVSPQSVQVHEGGTAQFTVAVAGSPGETHEATVAVDSGDADITVASGAQLIFHADDYSQPQTVTVAAARDEDCLSGSASVLISAKGLPPVSILVSELDAQPVGILYVDGDAPGANTGISWRDALTDLRAALEAAAEGDGVTEIHVAQGVYKPAPPSGNRTVSFQLVKGVALKGGYAGWGAPDPDARDVRRYETILSGDLNGDDREDLSPEAMLSDPSRSDNSCHVVIATGTDATAVLDGFTVTGGNAAFHVYLKDWFGGGVYAKPGSPTIMNCLFKGNAVSDNGGAIYCPGARVTNCTFFRNAAGYFGGAVGSSTAALVNCVFAGNRAKNGGAVSSAGTIINCTFTANQAEEVGGAIGSGTAKLTNCVVWGNSAPTGPEIFADSLVASHNDIKGGRGAVYIREGGAIAWEDNNIDADPGFVSPRGPDHVAGTGDDDLRFRDGSPCIDTGSDEPYISSGSSWVQTTTGVDAALNIRRHPGRAASGEMNVPPTVDMGAYEFGSPPIPPVLYVNCTTTGKGTGIGWQDAFTDLQRALQTGLTAGGKVREIWVAAGTYRPALPGDRKAAFHLVNGVAVYGGFAESETRLEERDATRNVTILSGDLSGTDMRDRFGRTYSNHGENSYHVVIAGCTNSSAVLDGFTIRSGNANSTSAGYDRGAGLYIISGAPCIRQCVVQSNSALMGGGVYCERSLATFTACTFSGNVATQQGGGIYCSLSTPTLDGCTTEHNSPDGLYCHNSTLEILKSNRIAADTWTVEGSILEGEGTLLARSQDVAFEMKNSRVRCDIAGPATIRVGRDCELVFEDSAIIDLGQGDQPGGRIEGSGLLRARDTAQISHTRILVQRASFEGDVNISNSVIDAEAGAPYGQFFIEDSVKIAGNEIHADGDRYMDLDPAAFTGLIANNRIYVTITEGVGHTRGGLFELRGRPDLTPWAFADPNNPFLYHAQPIPEFSPASWTIQELRLDDGAKVNLTNRFDFQPPYDQGGENEVLYVRNLHLGKGSVLNTCFNKIYYEHLATDPCAVVESVPLLGFSLNNIAFDDDNEFMTRVQHNNVTDPDKPQRIHVERVEGKEPDPNGMMRMCNLVDTDPESPTYGQVIQARAKGLFAKSNERWIEIKFEYLFTDPAGGAALMVYLSDIPGLPGRDDPIRRQHYLEVARLWQPPAGRPGSAASGRWGIFDQVVSVKNLNFIRGTRIELELVGPEGTCVWINNWDPAIRCYTSTCGDVDQDRNQNRQKHMLHLHLWRRGRRLRRGQ
jgi:predicted outer membrane repeat protein